MRCAASLVKNRTRSIRSPAIAEKAARTALSGTAVQHADDDYSICKNFASLLVHSTFLTYSLDGFNICGSIGGKFEGTGSVSGLKAVTPCSHGALTIHLFRHFGCII